MEDVIDACQVPFEEDGVNSQTLEDLKLVRLFLFLSVFSEASAVSDDVDSRHDFIHGERVIIILCHGSSSCCENFHFVVFVDIVAFIIVDVALIGRIFLLICEGKSGGGGI